MHTAIVFLLPISLLISNSDERISGRWQGAIQVPDRPLHATVDIDRAHDGTWEGSITIPELNLKGAALTDISEHGDAVSFAIKSALTQGAAGQARFKAQLDGDAELHGSFEQAGNHTSFSLHKSGTAQVDLPIENTAVSELLEGNWTGEYEFNGTQRHANLSLTNHRPAAATASLVFVGKRSNDVAVDFVRQEGTRITIKSSVSGITYEGRLSSTKHDLIGTLTQGAFDIPLTFHRSSGGS